MCDTKMKVPQSTAYVFSAVFARTIAMTHEKQWKKKKKKDNPLMIPPAKFPPQTDVTDTHLEKWKKKRGEMKRSACSRHFDVFLSCVPTAFSPTSALLKDQSTLRNWKVDLSWVASCSRCHTRAVAVIWQLRLSSRFVFPASIFSLAKKKKRRQGGGVL